MFWQMVGWPSSVFLRVVATRMRKENNKLQIKYHSVTVARPGFRSLQSSTACHSLGTRRGPRAHKRLVIKPKNFTDKKK